MKPELFCRTYKHWLLDPSLCFNEWQSLVAAIATLIVGLLTALLIKYQINQGDRLEHSRNEKRIRAADSLLISNIASLHSHAISTINELAKIRNADENSLNLVKIELPDHHQNLRDNIIESISSLSDNKLTDLISFLLNVSIELRSEIHMVKNMEPQKRANLYIHYYEKWLISCYKLIVLIGQIKPDQKYRVAKYPTEGCWSQLRNRINDHGYLDPKF